jgi:nucleotide-binding universal stress UspA family protein
MPYLLSTTYPSANGLAAAEYACGLAATLGCSVRLIHAYTVPVTFGEMPLPIMPADDVRALAARQMDTAMAELRSKYPAAGISSDLAYGTLPDVLDEAAQDDPPLLAIIGNDEEADWIGSNATDMLREARCAVLAVPHTAVFQKPAHVCIAVDGRSIAEGASVEALLRLHEACGFRITVLHILTEGETPVSFPDAALGKQLVMHGAGYIELPASDAVDSTVAGYAASQDVDWLAVIPHHYGFWKGLFHKSHTANMLHLAHLPILALH